MDTMTVLIISFILFAFLAMVFISIWVYKDAKNRGLNAMMWALLVLFTGNLLGLLLYILVGQKHSQIICTNCSSLTTVKGDFCSHCGNRLVKREMKRNSNRGIIIAILTFIILSFLLMGVFISAYFNTSGFRYERQYGFKEMGINSYANNISQTSSGTKWELSFDDTSEGYEISKIYNAKTKPKLINIDTTGSKYGTIQLIIEQGDLVINEMIGIGEYKFDLSDFSEGKLRVIIRNSNAIEFSCEIILE